MRLAFVVALAVLVYGCGTASEQEADSTPTYSSEMYSDPAMWLCGTLAEHDSCRDEQTVTEIAADGTRTESSLKPSDDPAVDCFYVYPTMAISQPPGNVESFDNLADIQRPLMAQAAPFKEVCRVFAPLYHQATLSAYGSAEKETYLDVAYADIADAFRHYDAQLSQGRSLVLIGHSQGAHVLRRLIQREIEPDAELRSRIRLALLIGSVGDLVVPAGALVGGSFASVPLCSRPDELGCVISFNTFAAGYPPESALFNSDPSMQAPCNHPAALTGGGVRLARSLFGTAIPGTDFGVSTNFAAYPRLFTAECVAGPPGLSYLRVAYEPEPGDVRTNPIPFDAPMFSPASLGLHRLDFAFSMHELIEAVRARSGAN